MLSAPKDPVQNAIYRKALCKRCQEDLAFREQVYIRCSRDFVFWCDWFLWTLSAKEHVECPDVPFILYPYQEDAALDLVKAIGNEDRLVEKSRDMGATWLILAVFVWLFVFKRKMSLLAGSRKAEYVDKSGDPKCLFWKIDYALEHLPGWMRPPVNRTFMHIENLANGSVIDGESTNPNFGAGDRRAAVLLDEFALVECGYEILASIGDVTNCCIYNSTPKGAAGAYFDTRQKFFHNYPHRLLTFIWWKHPVKGAGLYTTDNGKEGGRLKILDENYKYPEGYKFILDGKLRSPAFDERESRTPSRKILAQEWEISYEAAGGQAFDADKLEAIRRSSVRPPDLIGDIFADESGEPQFREYASGKLKLWFRPLADGTVPLSWTDIGGGHDIAAGVHGEYSSNSVSSWVRRTTGEKIAEFATNALYPNEFAEHSLLLAKWFNNAMIAWETNGVGHIFTDVVRDSKYRNVYYMRDEGKFDKSRGNKPGWISSRQSKSALLSSYFEAMVTGTFINHSADAINECGEYIVDGSDYVHQRSIVTEDPTAKGDAHGDRVIADALANRLVADLVKDRKQEETEPPPNSYRGRRLEYERDRSKMKRGWGQLVR